MSTQIVLYGAYGYTGSLISKIAKEQGRELLLAGRNEEKLKKVADSSGYPYTVVDLSDADGLDTLLKDAAVVLHAAGPFARTAKDMVDACLRSQTHYLDVTGEVLVFEQLKGRDKEAQEAKVMLCPGVGFDVIPSDCLALHLKNRLPDATHLSLAFMGGSRISHGTATTVIENLDKGGLIRRDGQLVSVGNAHKTRDIDFGKGARRCVTIPWGDVSTAYTSTGIPNIEVFTFVPTASRWGMKLINPFKAVLGTSFVQRTLKKRLKNMPAGPSDEERARASTRLWGEVINADGKRLSTRMKGPEGYTLTALGALIVADKVAKGDFKIGYQTPATAYGADLILEIEGTSREDLGE